MIYALSFLEGILTFISPCLLPMLPLYLFYFAGEAGEKGGKGTRNTIGFMLGFTAVFVVLGAFAGTLGGFLVRYRQILNLITGGVVILFGLTYLGVIRLPFRGGIAGEVKVKGFASAFLFGVVFSISWTPCVGVFLGSALMLASQQGTALRGTALLLLYSLGLGIPFLLSSLLLERLGDAFGWIKAHYSIIMKLSGSLLVVMGLLMATGWMGRWMALLA